MQTKLSANEVAKELVSESNIEQFARALGLPITEYWYLNSQTIADHCGTLSEFHRMLDAD
jgi:hypothetical protein